MIYVLCYDNTFIDFIYCLSNACLPSIVAIKYINSSFTSVYFSVSIRDLSPLALLSKVAFAFLITYLGGFLMTRLNDSASEEK